MVQTRLVALSVAVMLAIGSVSGQAPSPAQVTQERAAAERDAPKLLEVLELKPSMTVADVGAGGGAMTVVFGKLMGSGRVYATDIGAPQLTLIRDYVKLEGLTNVTVLEGATAATNLPPACCDAIFLRAVYHHLTAADAFDKSLRASLKPGGRLAVIDFVPPPGSQVPAGVPANRVGHGVPIQVVIDEVQAAGLVHVRTIEKWPPDDKEPAFLVLFKKPE
jgi:predicted methyltransferase